jgi:hypothetical protein
MPGTGLHAEWKVSLFGNRTAWNPQKGVRTTKRDLRGSSQAGHALCFGLPYFGVPSVRFPSKDALRYACRPVPAQPEQAVRPAMHNNTPWAVFRPTMAAGPAQHGPRPPPGLPAGPGISNFRPISIPGVHQGGVRPPAPTQTSAKNPAGPPLVSDSAMGVQQAQYRPMAVMPPQVIQLFCRMEYTPKPFIF